MADIGQLLYFASSLTASALFAYGAYWAFSIRRALATRPYKRQALWVGVVGLYFSILWISSPFTDPYVGASAPAFSLASLFFFLGFIMVFAWIDESMRVARRSDPLLRDTLRWKRVRIVIWITIAIDVITASGLFTRFALTGERIASAENIAFLALFLLILVLGGGGLFVSALRSGDPTFRRNLKWFGLFVAIVLGFSELGYLSYVVGLASSTTQQGINVHNIINSLISLMPIIGAFSLYRSARSLAPLGRLKMVEVAATN